MKKVIRLERGLASTHDLYNKSVFGGKDGTEHLGKVRSFVFHPKAKFCIGIIVKRPDVALMFHRKDIFVAIGNWEFRDGRVYLIPDAQTSEKEVCEALGIKWDDCVMWQEMPLIAKDGTELGHVCDVIFDEKSGAVDRVIVNNGTAENTLLGRRIIPADQIVGFRRGIGERLVEAYDEEGELRDDAYYYGALLVRNEAKDAPTEDGIAGKAGHATGKAKVVVKRTVKKTGEEAGKVAGKAAEGAKTVATKAVDAAQNAHEDLVPMQDKITAATEDALQKGALATGRQLKAASGMFSAFKEEFDKARE